MVRSTGAASDENSLSSPTGALLSPVVRRNKRKSAKRMSDTESRTPTRTEPTPNKTPRNERLLLAGSPADGSFAVANSGSLADAHIGFPHVHFREAKGFVASR